MSDNFPEDNRPISIETFIKFMNLEGITLDLDIVALHLDAAINYCSKRNETIYTKENCPHEVKMAILGYATHLFEGSDAKQKEEVVMKGVNRLLDIAREQITL